MSNQTLNVNRTGGPADLLDNFPGSGLADYTDATREYKPSYERPDWRVEAVRSVVLLFSLIVAWALFGLWRAGYCWDGRNYGACERIDALQPVGALAAILLVVGLPAWRVAVWGWSELLLARARAARVATTYNRWGDPQRIDQPLPLTVQLEQYRMASQLKQFTAPYETLHSINTYSPSYQQPKEQLALPAPADVGLVPPDTWLGWANAVPHLMFAAETGGGKSTTAKAVLAPRIEAGEHVFVIDPHSDDWFGLPSVGGGENWPEVAAAIDAVSAEYERRMQERERYYQEHRASMSVDAWTRLTVLMDEGFMARLKLDDAPRGQVSRWEVFSQVLSSGARKVGISVALLTQTANVEDLGISGPLRRNFFRLGLDHAVAREMLKAESNPERKKALLASLEGQQYPAVCEWRGQFHTLDRAGLDHVATPANAAAAWWPGWAGAARQQPAPADATMAMLRQARAAGWTRDEVRASGVRFTNDMWTAAQ